MGNRRAGDYSTEFTCGYPWLHAAGREISPDLSLLPSDLTPRTMQVAHERYWHRGKRNGPAAERWWTAETTLLSRVVVMERETGKQSDGQETE